jgi:hypothetical protein
MANKSRVEREGKIIIGEWGFGSARTSGYIVCSPEDQEAVQAAYDAIEDGDIGPDVLSDIIAAGGSHVVLDD